MKKILNITLGIVTSIGGYLDIGSLATAAQGGAEFGYQLLWTLALSGICVIFLIEMAGRFAAVSHHTIQGAMRERFGFNFFIIPATVISLVTLMLLGAELSGISIALEFLTGIGWHWWLLPAAFAVWLLLWKGTFGVVENGVTLLGLVTIVFIIGALKLHPAWMEVGKDLLPTLPAYNKTHYWFIAISIIGAAVTPYMIFFYSSGAIEDKWGEDDLLVNRFIAILGMSFGVLICVGILILTAILLYARGIRVDDYSQLPLMLTPIFGLWGFRLFAASLAVSCFGAALEVSLAIAYIFAQGLGWNWGESLHPREAARFSSVYTISILLAALLMLTGIDPLKLTNLTMALTSATLPLSTLPFLILMNDEHYMGEHTNSWFGNTVVLVVILLSCVLAVVTIPLEILGGS